MTFLAPSGAHPHAIVLENDELVGLLMMVDADVADEQALLADGFIARVGTVVATETDEQLYCEDYPSDTAAQERFAELTSALS